MLQAWHKVVTACREQPSDGRVRALTDTLTAVALLSNTPSKADLHRICLEVLADPRAVVEAACDVVEATVVQLKQLQDPADELTPPVLRVWSFIASGKFLNIDKCI